jgi:hypothetical protein
MDMSVKEEKQFARKVLSDGGRGIEKCTGEWRKTSVETERKGCWPL